MSDLERTSFSGKEFGSQRTYLIGETIIPFQGNPSDGITPAVFPDTAEAHFALETGEELPALHFMITAKRYEQEGSTGRIFTFLADDEQLMNAGLIKYDIDPQTSGIVQNTGFNEGDFRFFTQLAIRIPLNGGSCHELTPNRNYLSLGSLRYDQVFSDPEEGESYPREVAYAPYSDQELPTFNFAFHVLEDWQPTTIPDIYVIGFQPKVIRDAYAALGGTEPLSSSE